MSSIFEKLKEIQDLEIRAVQRGRHNALKEIKAVLKELGKSAKAIYKYADDRDTVQNNAYTIMCRVDDLIGTDYSERRQFMKAREERYKQAKKIDK